MKLKLPDSLLIVCFLTVLLIGAILIIPESWLRIVLGLPFLLFFPGYVLVEALFVRKKMEPFPLKPRLSIQPDPQQPVTPDEEPDSEAPPKSGMDGIERVALSFGMSIAVTALIGLGLNYTPWGIRLLPVLFSIAAFVLILSAVALYRRFRAADRLEWLHPYTFKMSGWEGSPLNKALTVILVIAILGAVGTLIYTVAFPKVGERFTEFYILGLQGKAVDYPSTFVLNSSVQYGRSAAPLSDKYGRVILGIVNQEQQAADYAVEIRISGSPAGILYQEQNLARLEGIRLEQGEKWEQEVGFAPQQAGENQKVEFLLYKDGAPDPYNSLHLWVNVQPE